MKLMLSVYIVLLALLVEMWYISAARRLNAGSRYYSTRLPEQLVYCRIPAMSCHLLHMIQRAGTESHQK